MTRKTFSTDSDFENMAGYSRALVQDNWCFVSGTTGYDYTTMFMPLDIQTQTQNCIETIRQTLENAEFALSDIVRANYYVTKKSDAELAFSVLGKAFASIRPAATMIVCGLIRPEMLIEIEVTALKSTT
ncbi:MAG: RidA family protein [Mariniblastus sp.]|jgi:enamine deaminase RidA (YjgF/YER057c/UK114 family)|nr:RidA family protein [Mariniblastus sp.]